MAQSQREEHRRQMKTPTTSRPLAAPRCVPRRREWQQGLVAVSVRRAVENVLAGSRTASIFAAESETARFLADNREEEVRGARVARLEAEEEASGLHWHRKVYTLFSI